MKVPLVFVLGSWLVASTLSLAADPYKDTVLADKPFAYYRLDETANTDPVTDEIGKNAGKYVNGPKVGTAGAVAADSQNTSVTFARIQKQYVKLTTLGSFGSEASSGFTVEYWLKTANATEHQNIVGTANKPDFITDFLVDIGYGDYRGRFRIYCRDDHNNRFDAEFFPIGKNINVFDNRWHHIAHVYDPKAKELNERVALYIDGERQTISVWSSGHAPKFSDFNNPVALGAMNLRGDVSDFLDGSLDEVAFYTSPLSVAQIKKHFRSAGDRTLAQYER